MDSRTEVADRMEGGIVSDTITMKGGGYRGEDSNCGILSTVFMG